MDIRPPSCANQSFRYHGRAAGEQVNPTEVIPVEKLPECRDRTAHLRRASREPRGRCGLDAVDLARRERGVSFEPLSIFQSSPVGGRDRSQSFTGRKGTPFAV
jgi:hypothetical protein